MFKLNLNIHSIYPCKLNNMIYEPNGFISADIDYTKFRLAYFLSNFLKNIENIYRDKHINQHKFIHTNSYNLKYTVYKQKIKNKYKFTIIIKEIAYIYEHTSSFELPNITDKLVKTVYKISLTLPKYNTLKNKLILYKLQDNIIHTSILNPNINQYRYDKLLTKYITDEYNINPTITTIIQ